MARLLRSLYGIKFLSEAVRYKQEEKEEHSWQKKCSIPLAMGVRRKSP